MITRTIKRHCIRTPVAALPAQILRHCPSAEPSSVVPIVPSALPPIKGVVYDPIPTQPTELASTASVVVSTPCNGIPVGSRSFSSLVDQYQQISTPRLLSHPTGVSPWPDTPQSVVTRSSSSMIISQSSIPPSAVTGLLAYGPQRGYPAKNRVVPLALVTLRVKTLFATVGAPSKKLTGKLDRSSDTRRTRRDIHAHVDPFRSSNPHHHFLPLNAHPQSQRYRSGERRHEVQTAVFTSPYPLLWISVSL